MPETSAHGGPSTPSGESPKGGFSWSVSRHDSFATCRRRYFYSYYAADEDPEIHRLKKLSALPLWAGSVVHETIEAFLRAHDRVPSPEEQEAIVRDRRPRECSPSGARARRVQADGATLPPAARRRQRRRSGPLPFRLFEHEYGMPVEQEDKKLVVGIVMRSLQQLLQERPLRRALAVGRERWLTSRTWSPSTSATSRCSCAWTSPTATATAAS